MQRGIRGAITVEENSTEAIKNATVELLSQIIEQNKLDISQIAYVMFSMTQDLDEVYPAKFAREEFDFKYVPMVCYQELNIKNSLKMCLRVMFVVNTDLKQNEIKHVYLKCASVLRPDLAK